MASFPSITSPCPLRFRRLPEPGRDYCTFCCKRMHNLDLMSEAERAALLGRGGSVCVAHSVQRAAVTALAGAGIAAAVAATPIHAQTDEIEELTVIAPKRSEHIQGGIGVISFELPPEFFDLDAFQRELAGRHAEFVAPPADDES